jgi:membrane protease subunit HflK
MSRQSTSSSGGAGLVIGIAIVLFAAFSFISALYTVNEQEVAVVTQFGEVVGTTTAGWNWKKPWIQKANIVDMTTHGMTIGYQTDENGSTVTVPDEGIMITSDFNFVDIDFYMEYKVSDPVAFLYNNANPTQSLKQIALASIRSIVSNYTVDEVITTGKSQIQSEIKEDILKELANNDIGLTVVNISIQDAEPPTEEIKAAFKAVETAKQGKETALNEANKYSAEQIPAAEAEADKIVQTATAAKAARVSEAEGEVAKFNSMYEEYSKYPLITKQRIFYEAMESIFPNLKIIITDGETQEMLPLDTFNTTTVTPAATESEGGN